MKLPKNLGLGKALNEGLKHCSHDWVFRMDTDDICVPERFAKQVAFIEQHPDTIIFGGQIAEFGENIQDIVAYRNVPTEAQDIVKFTQKRCPFNHMTVAYQKSAVINCGGYEDLQEESFRFGYRGVSGYIVRILEKRIITEISGGAELAKAIFSLLTSKNNFEKEGKEKEICQLLGSLMTKIERLNL